MSIIIVVIIMLVIINIIIIIITTTIIIIIFTNGQKNQPEERPRRATEHLPELLFAPAVHDHIKKDKIQKYKIQITKCKDTDYKMQNTVHNKNTARC